MNYKSTDGRYLLLALSVLVGIWGVLGWLDLAHQTQAGYDTDGNNLVTRVYPDSPAQQAGVEIGDRITHMDGVPVENAATIARQARKKPGEIQRLRVVRDGDAEALYIAYQPLPQRTIELAQARIVIGFCFLLFPLLAFYRNPAEASRILVVMGIGLSLAFLSGPYISVFDIRTLASTVSGLFILVGVAALLHFLLAFPHRHRWLDTTLGKKLLYLPALVLWALISYRQWFTPAATPALNMWTNVLVGLITGGYLLLSLFQVLQNYSKTVQRQRKALKLNSMLLGTVIALVPVTVAQLVDAFSPRSSLPGQDFYFLTLALIPLCWARSASVKHDETGENS